MDLETLPDRASDAINTIIRRDEASESGDFLPPCIEGTLLLVQCSSLFFLSGILGFSFSPSCMFVIRSGGYCCLLFSYIWPFLCCCDFWGGRSMQH